MDLTGGRCAPDTVSCGLPLLVNYYLYRVFLIIIKWNKISKIYDYNIYITINIQIIIYSSNIIQDDLPSNNAHIHILFKFCYFFLFLIIPMIKTIILLNY